MPRSRPNLWSSPGAVSDEEVRAIHHAANRAEPCGPAAALDRSDHRRIHGRRAGAREDCGLRFRRGDRDRHHHQEIHPFGRTRPGLGLLARSDFCDPGWSVARKSINVANTVYDRDAVGSQVPVTYVKSKPEYFYIPGTEPTQRDVGISDAMFKYG